MRIRGASLPAAVDSCLNKLVLRLAAASMGLSSSERYADLPSADIVRRELGWGADSKRGQVAGRGCGGRLFTVPHPPCLPHSSRHPLLAGPPAQGHSPPPPQPPPPTSRSPPYHPH